jgi:hypothetical protein
MWWVFRQILRTAEKNGGAFLFSKLTKQLPILLSLLNPIFIKNL